MSLGRSIAIPVGRALAPRRIAFVVLALLVSVDAWGMTADELAALQEGGEAVRIIDVRSSSEYQNSHIPGAVNVPAKALMYKRFPPIGRVVVYGSGIEPEAVRESVEVLDAMTGIDAEMLAGGFEAWEARSFSDTSGGGMSARSVPVLTYQRLVELVASEDDVVLVDLRIGDDLLDLAQAFPSARLDGLHRGRRAMVRQGQADPIVALRKQELDRDTLYVLIDDGDLSRADAVALKLEGSGFRRVAILGGGEDSIRNQGASESVTTTHSTIVTGGGNE